ncbi:unnamed protein product [Oikopleura dioica]|uniref:EF-hand domain-containing protein n=1 Tax=Oikopleura dioica TaxID=34765 RepID=E4WTB4_OIKDI|nr:unnamed protein product [Oikopleura dioica]CBY30499.1 unnamed protein product [Oikopleura dioica]
MPSEEGKARRAAAREKYGPQLRESFKVLDKDGSGYASVEEMTKHMVEKGMVKPGAREKEFVKSLNHYLSKMNYGKSKPGELNEEEFVKFWADLYALFDKIDKDGDGAIEIVECVELLDERAEKFGLTKGDLYKRVVSFYNKVDADGDRKISIIEFFLRLPELEEALMNAKL